MRYFIAPLFIFFLRLNVSAQLSYSLTYTDSLSSKVGIAIQLVEAKRTPVSFVMPRSVPGAYNILNYDVFIEHLHAINSKGEKVTMLKDDNGAPRWYYADTGESIVRVEYEVNLKKMEGRLSPSDASIIRSDFAGMLNYSIFGWIDGTEQEPAQCTIQTFEGWPIFTTNQPTVC